MDRRKRKRRGSERTQGGSERTPDGSERTPTTEEDPLGLEVRFSEPSEGWWNNYGFASLGEYFRYSRSGPDRPGSLTPARKKKESIPAAGPPTGAVPERRSGSLTRTRQVSIRLDEESYEALVRAARIYGVRPATMGRLLVAKGASKAVEDG